MALFPDIWNWEKGDGLWIDKKKGIMKWGLHKIAKGYRKLMQRKLDEGFINPEVKALYDCFNRFIDFYAESYTGPPGKKPGTDPRRQFHEDIRNIMCIMLDQDSHYLVEFFVWLSILKANYDKFTYRQRHLFPRRGDWDKYKALMLRRLDVEMAEDSDVSIDVNAHADEKKGGDKESIL